MGFWSGLHTELLGVPPVARELPKTAAISSNDVSVSPSAGCRIFKRQVKIVRRPSPRPQSSPVASFHFVAAVNVRHPEFVPMARGERDVHHALSIRRDGGLSCVFRAMSVGFLRMNVVRSQESGGFAIHKVNPVPSRVWHGRRSPVPLRK